MFVHLILLLTSKLLLWFVSNCQPRGRLKVFNEIKVRLPKGNIDIFGACGEPDPCKGKDKNCLRNLMNRYKFFAAFENSRCQGYITEQFWRAYEYGMVPLALGGTGRQDYEHIAPADSFLHVSDFSSIQSLANRLLKLDQDDSGYAKYFIWKNSFRVAMPYSEEAAAKPYCALCEELHKPLAEQKKSRSNLFLVRGNLTSWFYDECKSEIPAFTDLTDTVASNVQSHKTGTATPALASVEMSKEGRKEEGEKDMAEDAKKDHEIMTTIQVIRWTRKGMSLNMSYPRSNRQTKRSTSSC